MSTIGMTIADLDTPCLLVDLDRLETNIRTWQATIDAAGAALRPHVKTHKTPDIARMQLDAGACGITVAKLSEAEVFAAAGCDDIFVAYPVIGAQKWRRAAELARSIR
ncbi:MAG: alanine racemase, partial [Roseiflexus sp.]|nr:alanine racemase [Roseiflexus sp.]